MKSLSFFAGLALLIVSSSCSSNKKAEDATASTTQVDLAATVPAPPLAEPSESSKKTETRVLFTPPVAEDKKQTTNSKYEKKKLIKDGNISIKTKDIAASKKNIDVVLKTLNAYYDNESLQNDELAVSYNLTVRVPAENFEKLISQLENGTDEIKNKNISTRDVTEDYTDVETRLANKREYLKRYKELLSKAVSVKDILDIEENIRILEEEIESQEGRLNYLNDQIAYSTLNINLYKEKEFIYKPETQVNFFERIKTALGSGWFSIIDFLLWVVSVWPFAIITCVIFIVIRKIKKRKKGGAK
ncbi:MAG: DUF4349 domain-containing protein [Bacteroidetes bacterium]|nr:DUF4349 domain-containing protein [Bacteroidota bacterium]